ncbi:alpha/beta-hydrolase [Colletotrichum tofieldiae]|nr:alpha/beta-hydrolase [Colletotrichum tofieldiae]GKT81541.1 alpha/beta-hydrolase [Colletotrichum tofieldiae]
MDPNFWMSDLIDAIAAFINGHAKTSRAHLVGLGFGGHLALRVAGKHPDRTRSVFASGVNRLSPRSAGPDWSMAFPPFLV